jgi:hypothetical protein
LLEAPVMAREEQLAQLWWGYYQDYNEDFFAALLPWTVATREPAFGLAFAAGNRASFVHSAVSRSVSIRLRVGERAPFPFAKIRA